MNRLSWVIAKVLMGAVVLSFIVGLCTVVILVFIELERRTGVNWGELLLLIVLGSALSYLIGDIVHYKLIGRGKR